jgi:hypothetical protein
MKNKEDSTYQFMCTVVYTGCLKIREFRIQSVVGDHFNSPNMEIKKKIGTPPTKIFLSECALFFVIFFLIKRHRSWNSILSLWI